MIRAGRALQAQAAAAARAQFKERTVGKARKLSEDEMDRDIARIEALEAERWSALEALAAESREEVEQIV
jgi:hypothetical protein